MTLSPLRLDVEALELSPFPLDMTLVKAHCAVDGDDFDTLLELYSRAAIDWCEGYTHRTLYARTHVWVLRDFPRDCLELRLPRGKTVSVASIVYRASDGTLTTLQGPSSGSPAGTGYQEDLRGDDGGILLPPAGEYWPDVDTTYAAPVVVTFEAGYTAANVPADLIHALLFSVSDAYDTRGAADLGSSGRNLMTRQTLASAYQLVREY
jgi:uncharacterized phiE125 gp8 family phage protein